MGDLTEPLKDGDYRELSGGFGRDARTIDQGEPDVKKGALLCLDSSDLPNAKHGADKENYSLCGVALQSGSGGDSIQIATHGIFGPYDFIGHDALLPLNENDLGEAICIGPNDHTVGFPCSMTFNVYCGTIAEVMPDGKVKIKIGI